VVGQTVSQQQEVLWRVLAGVVPPGAFCNEVSLRFTFLHDAC
jgi:hypothetical protein